MLNTVICSSNKYFLSIVLGEEIGREQAHALRQLAGAGVVMARITLAITLL